MKYFTIQTINFPCTFITALSYAKQAETVQNARGFNRFQRMSNAEISLRINITRAICMASEQSFSKWDDLLSDEIVAKGTDPTHAYLAGNPLYAELLFAVTSMTRTNVYDELGELVSFECDLTMTGVSLAKDASRTMALIFSETEQAEFPEITITANTNTLSLDDKTVLTDLILTEKGGALSIAFQDGSKLVSRDVLSDLIGDPDATVTIENYGTFHVIEADLVDDDLSMRFSVFPIEWNQVETFSKINTTLPDIFNGWADDTNSTLAYIHSRETKISLLKEIENSLGLLVDYSNKAFHAVPDKLSSTTDFQTYIDEDTQTETITKLIWCDHVHQHTIGNDDGACIKVDSCCVMNQKSVAERCLKYAQFMQNAIKLTLPYDKRIRLFSVINIIKNATQIPSMVTHYEIDFMANEMTIEASYIKV